MSSWKTLIWVAFTRIGTCFNGATTMSSWKTGRLHASLCSCWPLQWSHDDVVVENQKTTGLSTIGWFGFNGATTMSSWKTPLGSTCVSRSGRFNGATTMSSWKTRQLRACAWLGSVDSMEPRRCRRGKLGSRHTGVERSGSFNGATTMSSWKTLSGAAYRRRGAVASMEPRRCRRGKRWEEENETRQLPSFNGATTMSSWKTCWPATGWIRVSSFNGATTMSSWKTLDEASQQDPRRTLQWSHDDVVVENRAASTRAARAPFASMEPRRCRRGKLGPLLGLLSDALLLQWSHDDVVVENLFSRCGGMIDSEASMEPRRCRRGKQCPTNPRSPSACSLQWSHDDVVVENLPHRRAGLREQHELQWSHDDVVVENIKMAWKHEKWLEASMEPRRCRRGKQHLRPQSRTEFRASMEPRRCRRGKPALRSPYCTESSSSSALQWSHDDVVVENFPFVNWIVQQPCSFNGATTMSSWKTSSSALPALASQSLQWSHDDVVVENCSHTTIQNRFLQASMEPRRCRRGKRSTGQ